MGIAANAGMLTEVGNGNVCFYGDNSQLGDSIIVIVISRFLKRYLKLRAPAYLRALRRIKGGGSREAQVWLPGGDRVAVKVCVDEMGRVNDQMDQGRSV